MNTFLSIAYKSSIELTLTFRNDPSENVIDVWLEIEIDRWSWTLWLTSAIPLLER